jgi:hypothetical protein
MSSLFQRHAQSALVLCASTSLPAWFDLTPIGDVALQKAVGIFIIDLTHVIMTELANFAAPAALTARAFIATRAIRSSLHELSPSILWGIPLAGF